jgi:acyl-[acyl-carrier-protein]-phospholipid O-acyltransferase / long-chain-fatty-acid--[acyl-carrier-protein] ligase
MDSKLSRSFAWLNAAQFCGALNDNVFKLLLVYFLIDVRGGDSENAVLASAGITFVLPFLLFIAAAGVLADRFSKRNILVTAKMVEVAVAAAGVGAFVAGSPIALYVCLFLLASHSAFFGPSKYGIVPELVDRAQLSRANALIQAFTYLAIILGTAIAPFLSQISSHRYGLASIFCVAVAATGLALALRIERTPRAGSEARISWFFVRDIWRTLVGLRSDGYLLLAVIASAYFLLLGAYLQFNLIPYSVHELGLAKETGTYLFLVVAVGIGMGSLLAGRMSGRNVELGVVPIGALGLALACLLLGSWAQSLFGVGVALWLAGVGSGLFIVPIEAWIQFRSPAIQRGEILAASSFLGWVGVLLASGLVYLLGEVLGLSAREGFVVIGLLTLLLTAVTLRVLPDFFTRFLFVLITRICYRLRIIGAENVPLEGPALLVCNHVSYVDALLLVATQQRRIRFLMEREIYETRLLKPLFKLMGLIPISFRDSPKKVILSFRVARAALDEGRLVCIFAEGALTRSGVLRSFKSGFEHIVKNSNYPIVPIYLGGAWGSIFSYYHGKVFWRRPLSFPYPVTILFGKPLPATATSADVRQAVLELSCDYFADRKASRRPLSEHFIQTAREGWHRNAISDSSGAKLTFGETLSGALAFAEELAKRTEGQDRVGLLLPPSVDGALANLAVTLLGKVPVNLNYTASAASFESAIHQCGIRCVIASRAFAEKFRSLPLPEGTVYIEEIRMKLSPAAKRNAWWKARFVPRRILGRLSEFNPDRVATVIFSSGSTGEPKGVMLSHHNLLSNIESLRMVFQPSPDDCVCGVLPFFHSFGFTGALWFPMLSGFSATYHFNPLDGTKIAELVRTRRATLLFATPTFLMAYIRRANPEDFASLRQIIVGAEKLKERIANAFEEKFHIRPLEGYGATELAPVATINIPDVELGGVRQVGRKEGSVGHPLPGVATKVIDPDTNQPVPNGQPGLLLIKGPNVMLGYLGKSEITSEVLKDGWYHTGDIVVRDTDGFIQITDRLTRFSKIGGEMVPHFALEETFHKGLKKTEQVLAVAAVPDEKRGERLVVLCTPEAGLVTELQKVMSESDLPNLWKPSNDSYFQIDALPMLGSGKLDLKALKEKAMRLAL